MINTTHPSNPFVGAWELVSGEYNENSSVINYEEAGLKSLKVLSENRFSFITSIKGSFYAAGGGEYVVENDTYTETPSFASDAALIGQRFSFQYQLDGDTWMNSRWQDGVRVEFEVWKRVRQNTSLPGR
jgi:hypothetical protein